MILVTGANGFIGRNLVLHLLGEGEKVVGVDQKPTEDTAAKAYAGYVEEICDVAEHIGDLVKRHKPAVIIALAEGATGNPEERVHSSAAAFGNMLNAARDNGVKRVCFASSLAVYLDLPGGPYREDMPLAPLNRLHISAVKKADEIVGCWYADHSDLEVVAMRLANIYGPRYHTMMNTPSRYLFEALGRPMPAGRPPLDNEVYRLLADFCHVEDCARGIGLIARAPKLQHQIYNIGGGRGVSDSAVRRAADLAVGRNETSVTAEATDNYIDITRISEELGYRPKYDIESGMAAYREWLRDNAQ